MNIVERALCLEELIAWEVENGKTLVGITLIERLEFGVLWSKTARGGRVYHQKHLASVLAKRHTVAMSVKYLELIDTVVGDGILGVDNLGIASRGTVGDGIGIGGRFLAAGYPQ